MHRITILVALATIACNVDVDANEQCPDWHDHDGVEDAGQRPIDTMDLGSAEDRVPYAPVDTIDFGRGIEHDPGVDEPTVDVPADDEPEADEPKTKDPSDEEDPYTPDMPEDDEPVVEDEPEEEPEAPELPADDEPEEEPEPERTIDEVPGNPTCADLGFDGASLKIDPPTSGVYTDGDLTIDFSTDGTFFDFESNLPVSAVIAKGGPGAMVYTFDPGMTYEWGFHSPTNASGKYAELSHATFCLAD